MYSLDSATMAALCDLRVGGGRRLAEYAAKRERRERLTDDGKLVILAADHPARMVTAVEEDPLRMADRADYLGRIVHILRSGAADGVMGTPDIIEELMGLDILAAEAGEQRLLAEKLLIGCMNRGGLSGTSFEMDDYFTAFNADQLAQMRLDGAKMMFRLEPMEFASGRTILACAEAINACLDHDVPVFLEPLMVSFEDGKYVVDKSVDSMLKIAGVASALGKSSWRTWLKLPYSVEYSRVAAATSCPILMLGGPATGDPGPLLADFANGMEAGENVRGALVGRNVLYPGDNDPADIARAIFDIVHQ